MEEAEEQRECEECRGEEEPEEQRERTERREEGNPEEQRECEARRGEEDPFRERLDRQFAFLREADKEKFIGRQTYLTDGKRKENDAEHAWHLALMTILLSEYAAEPIDVLRTVSMVLIHDIVEIDAGDTYAYDEVGKQSQRQREEAAAQRLYSLLPEDQGRKLRALWEEFEARVTPEARFARTMDNLQPLMLNAATQGRSWVENQVRLSQVLGRNERTGEGSQILWEYGRERFIRPNVEKGRLTADGSETGAGWEGV